MEWVLLPVSVNKNNPPERNTLGKASFQSMKSGGGKAVFPTGLHGQGLHKRNVFFTDTGIRDRRMALNWGAYRPRREFVVQTYAGNVGFYTETQVRSWIV